MTPEMVTITNPANTPTKKLLRGVIRMSNDNRSAYDSNIYDEHIVNVLPYYREYHDQIIDLVRAYSEDNRAVA
jgi:hypothetical protein